jgi:hypothetical protein
VWFGVFVVSGINFQTVFGGILFVLFFFFLDDRYAKTLIELGQEENKVLDVPDEDDDDDDDEEGEEVAEGSDGRSCNKQSWVFAQIFCFFSISRRTER